MGDDETQRVPRTDHDWHSLDLTQLVRLAYDDGSQSESVRKHAVDELWTRVQPEVDRMAKRLCADTQLKRRCRGPRKCSYGFCAAAQDEVFHRLFTAKSRDSFADLVATEPNLDDGRLWKRVRVLNTGLWESARRRVLALYKLPQRVDTMLLTFPHASCLQSIINDELGDDLEMFASYLISVELLDWLMALTVDAVHENYVQPNEARVLRYLSTRSDSVNLAVETLGDEHHDRRRIIDAIGRVDKALSSHHELACLVCGGLPTATDDERHAEATRELESTSPEIMIQLVALGLLPAAMDQHPIDLNGNAARLIIAVRVADGRCDPTSRASWYQRYIGEPRSLFVIGRPWSSHDDLPPELAGQDVPEWDHDGESGGHADD
jgi:hypothetical protein